MVQPYFCRASFRPLFPVKAPPPLQELIIIKELKGSMRSSFESLPLLLLVVQFKIDKVPGNTVDISIFLEICCHKNQTKH